MVKLESYSEIMAALKASEAGKSLQNTYRWSSFRMDESDRLWREILGATAQDFSHGQLMYGIARSFLEYEPFRFSPEQQTVFMFGVLSHDWGEAILDGKGVGDVSAQVKTSAIELEESVIARQVIASLMLPGLLKQRLSDGYSKVVEGRDQKLHHAFKALEKTEYVITATKVYQNCQCLRAQGRSTIQQELPLVGRVLIFDLSKVLDMFIPEYHQSIGTYFHNQECLIDEMLDYSLPWLKETKSWLAKPVDHAGFAESFEKKWNTFKQERL